MKVRTRQLVVPRDVFFAPDWMHATIAATTTVAGGVTPMTTRGR